MASRLPIASVVHSEPAFFFPLPARGLWADCGGGLMVVIDVAGPDAPNVGQPVS